jgi:hypothetical protein
MSLVPGFTVSTIILHFLQVGVITGITGSTTPAVVWTSALCPISAVGSPWEDCQDVTVP